MPIEDIANLIEGFARFQQHYFAESPELYSDLQEGQHPSTLLIGCCDSRVDPALLLGCDPGDIFTVRNIANLVPPSVGLGPQAVLAAIQYAVQVLKVDRIIILGHASCGGIRALMQTDEAALENLADDDYVHRWMQVAWPARELVMKSPSLTTEEERIKACEQASILVSLKNLEKNGLRTRAPGRRQPHPARLVFRPALRQPARLLRPRRRLSAAVLPHLKVER